MKNLLIYKNGATRWLDKVIPSNSTFYQEITYKTGRKHHRFRYDDKYPPTTESFYVDTFYPKRLETDLTVWLEQ